MQLKQMLEIFRAELNDVQEPYLWQDSELVHYLNQAVQEACERALLIEDRSTPAVCQVAVQAGLDAYNLHPSVLKVKRATYEGRLLTETSVEAMDAESGNWEARTGQPTRFILEAPMGVRAARLRLVPTPAQAGLASLTVYRGALKLLQAQCLTGEPEVPVSLRDGLKHWVYRCALLKNDADTQDAVRATEHEGIFASIFGAKVDANTARKRRDRKPPVIHCGW